MYMIRIFAAILLVVVSLNLALKDPFSDNDKYQALKKYLSSGKVKANVSSLGGYSGDCIAIELKNTSKDTVFLFLEPGRRLLCSDTTKQDILIVKKEKVFLPPLSVKKIYGFGFCCESSNGSPVKNMSYSIGRMAPDPWIKVCEFINDHPPLSHDAMQGAVWVMSNNHAVSSVYVEKQDSNAAKLRQLLANIKGVEVPWYSQTYVQDTSVFSNRPDFIKGTFKYTLKNNAIVSIVVRDKWGTIAKTLVAEAAKGPGVQEYDLALDVKGWGKGVYTITVLEDYGNFNSSRSFNLE